MQLGGSCGRKLWHELGFRFEPRLPILDLPGETFSLLVFCSITHIRVSDEIVEELWN